MEQQYIGEQLLPGQLGYLSIAVSLAFSLLAAVAYYLKMRHPLDNGWRNLGRISYALHGVAVLGIIASMFYLIHQHRFEYYYVYSHSSLELPVHFMISSFWEGQEGSFLLWAFWHVVLGGILIFTAKKWEAPVMVVMGLAQFALTSMLLGIDIFGYTFGSNPFILLRNAMEAPIFARADYLQFIEDGTGLNPLLQNYWMVIHPPVLFLGFAATIVPFAYALGALWTGQVKEWVRPVLPWTLFAVMILGTGILMGGAWAYEALSFGGFWAWDPVENASLIPWLIIVGGLHLLVIYKNTGRSLRLGFTLVMASFILVLYSTFLTRSGILGESSVHSFTDLGLSGQLLGFLFLFLGLMVVTLVVQWKKIPISEKEEQVYSREFWMFIGSLVLLLSAFQVFISTSIPVWNSITGSNLAPPTDPVQHYNKFQVPIAIFVALLTGAGQFFRYRTTPISRFWKRIVVPAVAAVVLTAALAYFAEMVNWLYIILLFAALFTVAGNADILAGLMRKMRFKAQGAAIAHIGFGLLLVGALISNAQQEVISRNTAGIDFGESFDQEAKMSNVMLVKNKPFMMGDYIVTYKGDSVVEPNTYFKVEYKRVDGKSLKEEERFYLYPTAQINPDMGLLSSPDTRHYLGKDIFTYVSSIPDKTGGDWNNEWGAPQQVLVNPRDTLQLDEHLRVELLPVEPVEDDTQVPVEDYDLAYRLPLRVTTQYTDYELSPMFIISGGRIIRVADEEPDLGLKIELAAIHPDQEKLELNIFRTKNFVPDYIIMKAVEFPFINFLWLGSLVMVIGIIFSIVQRVREPKSARV